MGSNKSAISKDALDEYVELTYLSKNEIRQIYKLLDDLEPDILKRNFHYRFPMEQIDKILPQIRDGHLSFEDILDLCSAFSANCPQGVRATWAFEIFDFDGDNQVSLNDLIETVQRLMGLDERGQVRIDRQRAENVARMVGVHSCCAFSTKDGIGKRLILLPKAAFCCNKFPVAVVDSAVESRYCEKWISLAQAALHHKNLYKRSQECQTSHTRFNSKFNKILHF